MFSEDWTCGECKCCMLTSLSLVFARGWSKPESPDSESELESAKADLNLKKISTRMNDYDLHRKSNCQSLFPKQINLKDIDFAGMCGGNFF